LLDAVQNGHISFFLWQNNFTILLPADNGVMTVVKPPILKAKPPSLKAEQDSYLALDMRVSFGSRFVFSSN